MILSELKIQAVANEWLSRLGSKVPINQAKLRDDQTQARLGSARLGLVIWPSRTECLKEEKLLEEKLIKINKNIYIYLVKNLHKDKITS